MPDQPNTPRKRNVKAAATKAKPDPMAIIKAARLPEKIVPLCLRPDLQEALDQAGVDYASVSEKQKQAGTLSDSPEMLAEIAAVEQAVSDALDAMREHTVNFRFRAISKPEHKAAIVKYPPRPGNTVDERLGYDLDAIEKFYVRTGCIEPELTDSDWDELEPALTPYQWDQLLGATNEISHHEATSVPFL